jgi:hypothetical protein
LISNDQTSIENTLKAIQGMMISRKRATAITKSMIAQAHQEDPPSVIYGHAGQLYGLNHGNHHQCSAYYMYILYIVLIGNGWGTSTNILPESFITFIADVIGFMMDVVIVTGKSRENR